ncbi:hypothetical protein [Scytonema sp. HK-05]|uniref:hypothetical protein n=1 Tax=Scytonema sp. HK-05 TaxID=1137095 RepID=UPI0009359794|nr:hypothetical protein NIES2130_34060 [Scytonema sp. HK-05]
MTNVFLKNWDAPRSDSVVKHLKTTPQTLDSSFRFATFRMTNYTLLKLFRHPLRQPLIGTIISYIQGQLV